MGLFKIVIETHSTCLTRLVAVAGVIDNACTALKFGSLLAAFTLSRVASSTGYARKLAVRITYSTTVRNVPINTNDAFAIFTF